MNPHETETAQDPEVETIESVHDPIVMAEAMREKLKEVEVMARQYTEVVKSQNCVPMYDK